MNLITGMHRSGTSITARLFFEAGGDLGDPKTFYRGDRWNPDGYFEQPDFHSVNMPLINGPWGKFSYFFLPSEKVILKRAKKFSILIPEISAKYMNKIVKETRFCLTFPAWKMYGTEINKVLINIREPIQVANSLKKRNHIPIRIGLKLWYEHNRRLLKYVENIPHLFLNYNSLLNPGLALFEFRRALGFFDIDLSEKKIENILKKHVRSSMNHNKTSEFKYEDKIGKLWENLQLKYSR